MGRRHLLCGPAASCVVLVARAAAAILRPDDTAAMCRDGGHPPAGPPPGRARCAMVSARRDRHRQRARALLCGDALSGVPRVAPMAGHGGASTGRGMRAPGARGRRALRTVHVFSVLLRGCLSALRSEEHTSELQSLAYLVCRLLLEKKKKKKK